MRYTSIILIFLVVLPLMNVSGQYYNTGQDPASVRWLRIKTQKFDVIYPEEYGQKGIDFARTLDESYSLVTSMFPEGKKRIPVVIHNYSTRSNGYVTWAPRRMEIYPAPDQNAIPGDQHKLLAIHETTHVLQMESLNTGFSGAMSFLFGEQFTGVTAALLPLWYLEGNAVVAETVLSSSGRGRNPAFRQHLKAIATQYGNYKYDKILNGSYRDYVPDHYHYGYQMTARAMAAYDPGIWNKVLKFTGEQPFTLNPVNISLRRNAGLTKKKLYVETFDSLKNVWSEELSGVNENFRILNTRKDGEYINYYSPVTAGRDSIIAIKTSMSSTPEIVLISGGKEKTLHRPGSMYPALISYGGGKLVWVEDRPDPRWINRDYVVIRILDPETGPAKTIARKTRYLSASVSGDGRVIAATENAPDGSNSLVLLDAKTGNVIKSIPSPGNKDIQRPQWSADGTRITVIFLTEEGEGIMEFSTAGNTWRSLIEAGTADLQSSFLRNDSLFFISSASGTDNIWLLTPGNEAKQLTGSRFGMRDLHLNGRNIFFSNYSAEGNNICSTDILQQFRAPENDLLPYIADLIAVPGTKTGQVSKEIYDPEPYRKWQHLFRFHSWMPFYADIRQIQSDPLSVRPGLTLMSQNTLSTLETTLAYEYSSDKRHVFHSSLTWFGWYPVISARLDHGYHPAVVGPANLNVQPGLRFTGEVSLPFYFSSGYFNQYLRLSVNTEFSNNVYPLSERIFDYGQTNITGRIIFSNYSRMAFRDIYPRWAQTMDIQRVSAPFDSEIFGSSALIRAAFYFPGLFRDHGLRIRLEDEKQILSKFIFANKGMFPRGFSNVSYPDGYDNIISEKLAVVSADYVFPVVYPDFNLSSLLYLKRIRSGFFFDHVWGTGNRYYTLNSQGRMAQVAFHDYTETFRSYGVEILADLHILRIPFPVSAGVQAAWRSTKEKPVLKAVFNMDLYGFSLGTNR